MGEAGKTQMLGSLPLHGVRVAGRAHCRNTEAVWGFVGCCMASCTLVRSARPFAAVFRCCTKTARCVGCCVTPIGPAATPRASRCAWRMGHSGGHRSGGAASRTLRHTVDSGASNFLERLLGPILLDVGGRVVVVGVAGRCCCYCCCCCCSRILCSDCCQCATSCQNQSTYLSRRGAGSWFVMSPHNERATWQSI